MKLRAAWAVGLVLAVAVAFPRQDARADLVTDWNKTALEVMKAAKAGRNPASRALAMVHVAVSDAVNTVQGRYTRYAATMPAASSAARTILVQLYPAQKAMIEEAFDAGRAQGFGRGARDRRRARPEGAAHVQERCRACRRTQEYSRLGRPMHPEYPSQASIASGVIAAVLESVFGPGQGVTIGIHFRNSVEVAQDMGKKIADYMIANTLKPVR